MPLQDHFRPPLGTRRHWHSFHSSWATYISSELNRRLPPTYFAEPNVQFGIEIDVAAFEETESAGQSDHSGWTPGPPAATIPLAVLSDVVEVAVFRQQGGPTLVGALELVSPANKDRPDSRAAFVSKCQSYVQEGIGLVVIDVVTERRANLHNELVERLHERAFVEADLYAVAYRPARQADQNQLEIWPHVLQVGHALPAVPLWLRGGPWIAVDLEATYVRTCNEQRISVNGA